MSPILRSTRAVGGGISVRTIPSPNHRTRTGCHNCRLRGKKCDGSARLNVPCGHCTRLSLQCLGYGDERPDWMRKHESQLKKAMRRHISSRANKTFTFERYYEKHAWRPSCVPLDTSSTAPRNANSGDSSNTTSDDESEEDTVGCSPTTSPFPQTPTSSQLPSPGDQASSSSSQSPTFSFSSPSPSCQLPSPEESIQSPHPISVVGTDGSISILLDATGDERAHWDPNEPDSASVPQKCSSPSVLLGNSSPMPDDNASACDMDELEERHFQEYIYYPEVLTMVNEGATTVGRTSTGTSEPVNTVPQAVSGDSVKHWVQQLPAQDATLGTRPEEPMFSDPHCHDSAESQVQAYLDYIKSVCAGANSGPSTSNIHLAQGTSYACLTEPEQQIASPPHAGTNSDSYSLPRAINDYLAAYFARLNPAISHNQCSCQDHSAGISAHELSTVLAFVQGLPERVGWSVDIDVIHGVVQKCSVFDQRQPLSNLQPADHEMYALLAMFGVAFDLLKGGAGGWEWYLKIASDWFRSFYLSLPAGHSLLSLGTSRILGELVIWMDILGSVTRRRPPYLSDIYREIEGRELGGIRCPFRLENVMGCSNSVMFGIARISELSYWKVQEAATGDLSTTMLCQMAETIRLQYLSRTGQNVTSSMTHPSLLGNLCGLLPFASPSTSHLDYLGSGILLPQSSPSSPSTITEAYRLSALVYLQTVVSGPLPSSQEMRSAVSEAVDFLYRVPPAEMDRCLIFPFFVTACTSLRDQRIAIGRRLCGVNCAETVGNGRNALVVVKELWRYLDNDIPVDWCQIMEQQRRRVLLA